MTVTRGCGRRVKGGIYIEVALSPYGRPLEDFLVDPPKPIDPTKAGIAPVGVKLMTPIGEPTHVLDWVGSNYYPNVADFVEETKRFGLSRRISSRVDFSKLGNGSHIFLMHSHAYIANHAQYPQDGWLCPKRKHRSAYEGCCAGIWWRDLRGTYENEDKETDVVIRRMPAFQYPGFRAPANLEPGYAPAIFMVLPITRLAMVAGGEKDAETWEAVCKAGLTVEWADE